MDHPLLGSPFRKKWPVHSASSDLDSVKRAPRRPFRRWSFRVLLRRRGRSGGCTSLSVEKVGHRERRDKIALRHEGSRGGVPLLAIGSIAGNGHRDTNLAYRLDGMGL